MQEVIISQDKQNNKIVALVENGKLVEKYEERPEKKRLEGNIYLGKVENVLVGMQAAFVDIGVEKNTFIHIKDIIPKVSNETGNKNETLSKYDIKNYIHTGMPILVQVKRDSTNKKGARVSTHITIPGNYVVLMPNTNIITISQKIEDAEERERLLEILKENIPNGFGAIIRTDAYGMDESKIKNDIQEIVEKWYAIYNKYQESSEIALLYNEHELVSKIGRDLITKETKRIFVNTEELYSQFLDIVLKENVEVKLMPSKNVIEELGLTASYESAFKRKIWLKCGGYIVIDKTEALTAIDVNSGKYVGNKNLEQTALIVNKEAAAEIMHQIRLRDVGGIIVVDYIDLSKKENQAQIIEIMQEEAKKDRSKIDIKGYTELNLVELTRKTINI